MLTDVRSIACFVRCAGDVVGEGYPALDSDKRLRIQNRAIVQRAAHSIAAQILKHFATRVGGSVERDDAERGCEAVADPRGSSFGNVSGHIDRMLPASGSAPRAQRNSNNADAREP